DVKISQATEYMRAKLQSTAAPFMTRWQEAEDRLHIMMDLLAYIPAEISLSFLNSKELFNVSHANTSPEEFAKAAHATINAVFTRNQPNNGTPLYARL